MTGCEKVENRLRWSTVGIMFLVMILMRHNRLFALYGMCTQALSEGILKYIYVRRWFKIPPVPIWQQILLWIPSLAISAIAVLCKISTSFIAIIPAVICAVVLSSAIELCDKEIRNKVFAGWADWRKSNPGSGSTERERQKYGTKNHRT